MKKIYLSVVIPAYNEEKNLELGVLDQVRDYMKKQKYEWEVLVVDDGSRDRTTKIVSAFAAKHPGFKLLKEPHRGKGGTVIAGMLQAAGEIVLFTDMDQATPLDQVDKMLPFFKKGYSVVIGSRSGRRGAPLIRKFMAYGFAFLRTLLLRLPYKDTNCGFKAFTRDAAHKIFSRMKLYTEKSPTNTAGVTAAFDVELLYIARKLKLKVTEVPVNWEHKGTERVRPVKDSLEGIRDLIRVRYNALLGKYSV